MDFVILEEDVPLRFIECKTSQRGQSRSLRYLKKRFPQVEAIQVNRTGKEDLLDRDGIRSLPAHKFLAGFV